MARAALQPRTLKSWPSLWRQIIAANNIRPKDVEDAAKAGALQEYGNQPGRTFLGSVGEAMFADVMAQESLAMMVSKPPLPDNQIGDVIGKKIPDLYSVAYAPPNVQIFWRNVIGPSTGGQIAPLLLMNDPRRGGVVLGMYEITTSGQARFIFERAEKVAEFAGNARRLGLPLNVALAIDRGALYSLSAADQQRLITQVTSAGGYIFVSRDLRSGALRNVGIIEDALRRGIILDAPR
jgi:hypothetical protein